MIGFFFGGGYLHDSSRDTVTWTDLGLMVLDKLIRKEKMSHYKKIPIQNTFFYSLDIGNRHSEIFRALFFLIKSQ